MKENDDIWMKNSFPKKVFLMYTITFFICLQVIILISIFLIIPFYKNIFAIIFIYIFYSIVLIYLLRLNYIKTKSKSDFDYKLTEKGILIKRIDFTQKFIAWRNISNIRDISDVKGIFILEKNSVWPYQLYCNEEIKNKIKDYYKQNR